MGEISDLCTNIIQLRKSEKELFEKIPTIPLSTDSGANIENTHFNYILYDMQISQKDKEIIKKLPQIYLNLKDFIHKTNSHKGEKFIYVNTKPSLNIKTGTINDQAYNESGHFLYLPVKNLKEYNNQKNKFEESHSNRIHLLSNIFFTKISKNVYSEVPWINNCHDPNYFYLGNEAVESFFETNNRFNVTIQIPVGDQIKEAFKTD